MTIQAEFELSHPPDAVWAVVGDPVRVDWVPGVESCRYDGEVRRFTMAGAGGLAERILLRDAARRRLEYSVVESEPPLEMHRASITVEACPGGSRLIWTTTVKPAAVEPFIRRRMDAAIAQLRSVLAASAQSQR